MEIKSMRVAKDVMLPKVECETWKKLQSLYHTTAISKP